MGSRSDLEVMREAADVLKELGVPFDEHVQRVLTAMQGIAGELGLDGA